MDFVSLHGAFGLIYLMLPQFELAQFVQLLESSQETMVVEGMPTYFVCPRGHLLTY